MGLRIYETDPDAAPGNRTSSDVVGRIRSGEQVNNRPVALEAFRITTGDPELAERLGRAFDVDYDEWETEGEDNLNLYTARDTLDVLVAPDGIRSSMILWGRNGMIRQCDGVEQFPDDNGNRAPCQCPQDLAGRKDAAKAGNGCQPSIVIWSRLENMPDAGKFKYVSSSWGLVESIGKAEAKLAKFGTTCRATLGLELVEYVAKGGKMKGRTVSFRKPYLTIHGPVEAEDMAPEAAVEGDVETAADTAKPKARRTRAKLAA